MSHRVRSILGGFALLSVLSLASAAEAVSQERPISIGVAGGGSFPLGEIADEFNAGFHIAGLFELASLGSLPIGLRLEGGFQEFTKEEASLTHLFGRVNAVRDLGDSGLYLIAGLGLYNSEEDHGEHHDDHDDHDHDHDGEDHGAETIFGFNGGAGWQTAIGPLNAFVEARFHTVLDEVHTQFFVPISIGFRF